MQDARCACESWIPVRLSGGSATHLAVWYAQGGCCGSSRRMSRQCRRMMSLQTPPLRRCTSQFLVCVPRMSEGYTLGHILNVIANLFRCQHIIGACPVNDATPPALLGVDHQEVNQCSLACRRACSTLAAQCRGCRPPAAPPPARARLRATRPAPPAAPLAAPQLR